MNSQESIRQRLATRLVNSWYGRDGRPLTLCLLPWSWLFKSLVTGRRFAYRYKLLRSVRMAAPVIIVGNITVGGTGKTPLVVALVELLKEHGFRPGIISRGYGGQDMSIEPQQVTADSNPFMVGDEPVLLAQRAGCPVVIGKKRAAAAQTLLNNTDSNIIISDDGLQHYALARDIEIAVLDGQRRLGNGHLLPAGPLREPAARLKSVDFVIINGDAARPGEYAMYFKMENAVNVVTGEQRPLAQFALSTSHALAGIGHPARFFESLRCHGLNFTEHSFPDHYNYRESDIDFADNRPVFMTEKDAVKCRRVTTATHYWYVPVHAQLNADFAQLFLKMVYALQ